MPNNLICKSIVGVEFFKIKCQKNNQIRWLKLSVRKKIRCQIIN
jgi:hypothetical protein